MEIDVLHVYGIAGSFILGYAVAAYKYTLKIVEIHTAHIEFNDKVLKMLIGAYHTKTEDVEEHPDVDST